MMTLEQLATITEILGQCQILSMNEDNSDINLTLKDDTIITIWADGAQRWWQHGKIHRDGGPAIVWADGSQHWFQHGKLHRDDGPAVFRVNGYTEGQQHWYLHGKEMSQEEYARRGEPAVARS